MLVTKKEDILAMPADAIELKGVDLTDNLLLLGIQRAPTLRRMDLLGCEKLTDASTARLASLTYLEEIDLGGCNLITDSTPRALSMLPRLRSLSLGFCYQITDMSLVALARTLSLEKLLLWSCESISDKGVKAISNLPNLLWLELPEFADITDQGVAALGETASQLFRLRLSQLEHVSDRGIIALRQLRALRKLRIEGCKGVSEEVVAELQRALPECQIELTK